MEMLPPWFQTAIIYHILIDRFAGFTPRGALGWDKPGFVGGHLAGIQSKLDYLADLGITTLWLSPFYQTTDYHGYHITDFREVDDRFGGLAALRNLTAACHARGIRIIADLVPNHCHQDHPFFQDALASEKSPYRHWFLFDARNNYQSFLGCGWLPKLNLENMAARNHMIQSACHWLDQGIDGFRIDHVIGVSHGCLTDLSTACKQKKPDCVLFGEAVIDLPAFRKHRDTLWVNHKWSRTWFGFSQDSLQQDYCGILNGVLDFVFRTLASRYAEGRLTLPGLKSALRNHFIKYPPGFALVLFLDSHDEDRLLCRARGDANKLRSLTEIMLEYGREYGHPVSFYYGFEILLNQVVPMPRGYPHRDLLSRRAMDWPSDKAGENFRCFIREQLKTR